MIVAINYADSKFRATQKLNTKTAKKIGKVDKVIEYSPADIDAAFYRKNKEILDLSRGNGYWLWKPYFIKKTLDTLNDGDYLIYSDSGAAYVNDVKYLISVMNRDRVDIMPFCIDQVEIKYNKRDTLVIMDADKEEFLYSNQVCGSYMVLRKSAYSEEVISEWLDYAQDKRLITDQENVVAESNYPEFFAHRHDQSIWSLLCKKRGITPYRDPSQFGETTGCFPIPKDVLNRSDYPQIFESHRNPNLKYYFQLEVSRNNKWCIFLRIFYGKNPYTLMKYLIAGCKSRVKKWLRECSNKADEK